MSQRILKHVIPAIFICLLLAYQPIEAADTFSWCGGRLTFDPDRWGYGNGSWTVYNWFYHRDDTHVFALRVDESTTYATDNAHSTCPVFTSVNVTADEFSDYAMIQLESPEGTVTQTFAGVSGSCCGLDVTITVENTDTVAHYYEWRVYHDTGFGENISHCAKSPPPSPTPFPKDIVTDGGKVCLGNLKTCYFTERHLENIPCRIGFVFWDPDEDKPAPMFQFMGDNLPYNVEVLDWSKGLFPCIQWNELVSGNPIGGCEDDNSLLIIWRMPERGTLLPGDKSSVSYMISDGCLRPCDYPTPVISPPPVFTPTPSPTPTAVIPIDFPATALIILVLVSTLIIGTVTRSRTI